MASDYSKSDRQRALQTLESVENTICQLIEWNKHIVSAEDYYSTLHGTQLLAANCTLITAIGEGINRVNRVLPGFLQENFANIPWHAIVGMRNHITHGYFELDADLIYEAVRVDIPPLQETIFKAILLCRDEER